MYQRYGEQNMSILHEEKTMTPWPKATFHHPPNWAPVPKGEYIWIELILEKPKDTKVSARFFSLNKTSQAPQLSVHDSSSYIQMYVNGVHVASTDLMDTVQMTDLKNGSAFALNRKNHFGSVYEYHWTRVDGRVDSIFPPSPLEMRVSIFHRKHRKGTIVLR